MKTVLITGAGRNIGRNLAETFGAVGFAVIANARSQESVEAVAEAVQQSGGQAIAAPGDVRDPEQVRRVVEQGTEAFGSVDVLINCAGARVTMPIEDMTPELWRTPLEVILDGAFHCSQSVLPQMRDRGWGRIINIIGVSGQVGAPNRVGVVTAKSGLMGFTKALALETASQGITVNAVSPGLIDTDRGSHTSLGDQEAAFAHYKKTLTEIPMGRYGLMEEVSGACHYLASDTASFITGQTLSVNGGLAM